MLKRVLKIAGLVAAVLLGLFLAFYFFLPAISIHNSSLVTLLLFAAAVAFFASLMFGGYNPREYRGKKKWPFGKTATTLGGIAAALLLTLIIGGLASSKIFNAGQYQKMLSVQEGSFSQDIKQASWNEIPKLDKDSVLKLGDKKMGEMVDIVSQFEVSDIFSQINYKNRPVRVSPLVYGDFIKWINNSAEGIPAYMIVDMVTQEVTLVRLEQGIKYSPSEYFNRNLYRHLRFNYPTWIFGEENFEIDEQGKPFWVVPKIDFTIGLYGGRDIGGIVLVDAVTGDCSYYDKEDIPSWVDGAFDADIIIEQFDNWGTLKHGFINSVFGQRDSLQSTAGYNYIAMNDDIYMYTGVTSVGSDESNVGFLLTNLRTKESKYYNSPGATEGSAMSSAEGKVQQMEYNATFPLLLNIADEPTYFISLKDNAGLVKLYAMVNVKQYQIVATGESIQECENAYIQLLIQNGNAGTVKQTETIEGVIADIRTAVIDGNSHYYITLENSVTAYSIQAKEFREVITYNLGDTVKITFVPSDEPVIDAQSIERLSIVR